MPISSPRRIHRSIGIKAPSYLKISVHRRGVVNRFAWGCRRGIFTPSLDLRKQGEPGGTLHVGHASLIAGHIFRSYLANSWLWIFQPSSLRIGMDSSREHPKPNLLWVALLQGQHPKPVALYGLPWLSVVEAVLLYLVLV
jgi:hypothetical protein